MDNVVFDALAFSVSVTGPICIVLGLGILLKKIQLVNDNFVHVGSKLVFTVTLPSLLFITISQSSFRFSEQIDMALCGVVGTLLIWFVTEFIVTKKVGRKEDRGALIVGIFRGNMGVFGLAYCFNAMGSSGLVLASLYLASVTILYNILTVITLNRSIDRQGGVLHLIKDVLKNPLMIGILLGLLVAWSGITLPQLVIQSGQYFSQMTLPLALICTGASLSSDSFRRGLSIVFVSAFCKLMVVPVVMALLGLLVGLRENELAVVVLMSCVPTAAAAYVMVQSMGSNSELMAKIIVATTLGSLLTTTVFLTLLKSGSFI